MKTVVKWLFGLWVGTLFANVLIYGSSAMAEALTLAFPSSTAVAGLALVLVLLGMVTSIVSIFVVARMVVRGSMAEG